MSNDQPVAPKAPRRQRAAATTQAPLPGVAAQAPPATPGEESSVPLADDSSPGALASDVTTDAETEVTTTEDVDVADETTPEAQVEGALPLAVQAQEAPVAEETLPTPTAAQPRDTTLGLSEEQIARARKINLPIGTELLCGAFEGTQLMAGTVLEVDEETHSALLMLDNGRRWPVHFSRLNLGIGEWDHVDKDYPKLGEDPEFDERFRLTDEQREILVQSRAADAEAEITMAREIEASAAKKRAAAEAVLAAPPPPPGPKPVGVDATWMGPGALSDAWTRHGDHRELDHAEAGARGFFRARTVQLYRSQFTIHDAAVAAAL